MKTIHSKNISTVNRIRFFSKVFKTEVCWIWTGTTVKKYGQFYMNNKKFYAHRISYAIHYGKSENMILHKCNNPPCVNPDHLYEGTYEDNKKDQFISDSLKGLSWNDYM